MRKTDYELQKKAFQFRYYLGAGAQQPIRFKSIFLKLGIVAVYKELSDKFSGMSIKLSDYKFILINSSHPIGRQNFTICHELYHLYLQDDFKSHTCITGEFDRKDTSEYDADRFASYLLMPEDGIIDLIPEAELKRKNLITLPTFLKIEQYFRCSRTALLYRLDGLKLIDKDRYEDFRFDVSKEAIKHGFGPSLYQPGNKDLVIGDYGEIAKKLFDKENISESHYAKLMRDIGIDIDIDIKNHDRS